MSLLTDLAGHWKLNEASGTRNDSHGTNHLTDNNTVASATGKIGNAADFEAGNAEYLSIADNASLSLGTDTPFSIAFWVHFESIGGSFHPLIDKAGAGSGTGDEFLIDVEGGGWRFYVGNGSSFQSVTGSAGTTGTPATGQWYFVVCWHDPVANTLNIEVNNNGPIRSASWSGGTQDGTASLLLGKYNTAGLYHDGLLDSVSFWKRVLTSGERTELYNSGNGLDYESFGGGSAQTLNGVGIASTAANGVAALKLTAAGAGIAPTVAMGAGSLRLTAAGAGVASAAVNGTAALKLQCAGSGVASTSANGVAGLRQNLAGSGRASAEALGVGVLTLRVGGVGIASGAALGIDLLLLRLAGVGRASGAALGTGLLGFGTPNVPAWQMARNGVTCESLARMRGSETSADFTRSGETMASIKEEKEI